MPNHRQAQRIDSAQRWEEVNPILEDGELGIAKFYDEDGKVIKMMAKCGDGIKGADGTVTGTRWNDLPWLTGQQGEKGDVGPRPEHNWKGTSLRFQNADSTWGEYVDLKGEPGNRVNAEPATTTTLGGVMPATGLRVNIEGYEYVALGWDKEKCYPDPIVVAYDGSPWLWLQESGVGTEAGVRVPGLETSAQYWRQIANIVDIPKPGIGLELDAEANAYDVKYGNESGTALEGNGVALSAKKLQTPRTITVELGQQSGEEFDGTANITPGVSGILNPANGGTGVNSLQALAQALQQTGLIGGKARKVGEYGAWRYAYALNQNLVRLEGLTPGKLLFVRGLSNQGDAGRAASDVAAYASIYPSISGIWGGMGNKYPGIWNGNYFHDRPTFDPVNNSAAVCRNSFDAKLANPDGVMYFQGNSSFLMRIRSGVHGLDSEDVETFGQNFFLIHSSTVRLCCTSLSGDDYPVVEFWEY